MTILRRPRGPGAVIARRLDLSDGILIVAVALGLTLIIVLAVMLGWWVLPLAGTLALAAVLPKWIAIGVVFGIGVPLVVILTLLAGAAIGIAFVELIVAAPMIGIPAFFLVAMAVDRG